MNRQDVIESRKVLTQPGDLEDRHRREDVVKEKVETKPSTRRAESQDPGCSVRGSGRTYRMMLVTIVMHPIAIPRSAYGNEPVRWR